MYASTDLADGVRKDLDKLDEIFGSAKEKIGKIQRTPNLTAKGKQAAFRSLSVEVDRDLTEWRIVEKHLADQIRQLEEAVAPRKHSRDDFVWALELREIRDHIKSLDPAEQESFVLNAASSGDQRVMEAIQFAPIPLKFTTQQAIDKISAARSAIQHSEEAVKLADRKLALQADRLRPQICSS